MNIIHSKKSKNLNQELKFATTKVKVFVWLGKEPVPVEGFSFVSDIKKTGIEMFMATKMALSKVALVAFERADSPPFRARVNSSKAVNANGNAEAAGSAWKCGFTFEFASDEEKNRYEKFWNDIRAKTSKTARKDNQVEYKIVEKKPDDDLLDDGNGGGGTPEGNAAA